MALTGQPWLLHSLIGGLLHDLLYGHLFAPSACGSHVRGFWKPPLTICDLRARTRLETATGTAKFVWWNWCFISSPTVGAKCSGRLTWVVFTSGLYSRARAPSFSLVYEYLKKKNKGAPSRPFALRRSSQLARNTKVTENCMIISITGTVWLNCVALIALCSQLGVPSRTTRV